MSAHYGTIRDLFRTPNLVFHLQRSPCSKFRTTLFLPTPGAALNIDEHRALVLVLKSWSLRYATALFLAKLSSWVLLFEKLEFLTFSQIRFWISGQKTSGRQNHTNPSMSRIFQIRGQNLFARLVCSI